MNVLIVEDEKLAADHLADLVRRYDSQINILARVDAVKKGVEWFSHNPQPDLAFFDIQLADGLSFEIFEQADVHCPVIFTTAFNEYALKAFKVNSVDYLLKPLDYGELAAALEKFRRNRSTYGNPAYQQMIDNVLGMLSDNFKKRFIVKVGEHIRSVPVSRILYFFSLEKATFLHTKDNHNYVLDYSLDQVEEMVDPGNFFRINRKYLVAMEAIEDIITYSNSRLKIELKDHKEMDAIVAREKVSRFKSWLDR